MVKRSTYFIIAIIVFLALMGCEKIKTGSDNSPRTGEIDSSQLSGKKLESVKPNQQSNQFSSNSGITSMKADKTLEQVKGMTLDEKIGQMIISGVDGYINNEHSRELINKYHIGGFILLGKNVKNTNQVLSLLNSLKKTNIKSGSKIPLFLGVDQEGGRVDRMPLGFKKLPTNKAIGQINNIAFSSSIGKILGQEVKAFGYNIDFAPVLDINSNPKNPVIGDRSFGSTSEIVTKLGVETMKGIRSENIISVVKHFPGHGDTSVDSHTGLPIVNYDLSRLESFELIPFEAAIKNNVDMIMIAHILFPKIDSQYPSSLSKTIITGVLRNSMKYNGIVITDDMTMGAIANRYNIGKAAVRSINAGSNIILVCHDFNKELQVINALKTAVQNGTLSQKTVDNSVYKILKLKQKYNLFDKNIPAIDVNSINNLINKTLQMQK